MLNQKNVPANQKIYQLLNKTLNPFEKQYNFSEGALRSLTGPEIDDMKIATTPDPRIPKSLQRLFYAGSEFQPEY